MGRLKHRWSLGNNYLAGITTKQWIRLLYENNWAVDPAYWHRAAFITLASLMNEFNSCVESLRFRHLLDDAPAPVRPVFILGHWRSGTTHLHNLMAQNDEAFAFANTYQVVNPLTFLSTENLSTKLFRNMVPSKRPMDNVDMAFESPQEDEFGPLLMSLKSVYLSISFPKNNDYYQRYLTFREADIQEQKEWKNVFLGFLKKVQFKNPGKRLLLKTPAHTGRVSMIRSVFPDAQFIHIHRDPSEVYRSFQHYYDTAVWYTYLQRADRTKVDEQIRKQYRLLYESYFRDLDDIPNGNFTELSYKQLEDSPLDCIRSIYKELDLEGEHYALKRSEAYLNTLKDYKKNNFAELDESEKRLLREQWGHLYERWGYRL